MAEPFQFADVLQRYVTRSAYTAGQLARLSGIPKTTIMSWLTGQVKRPYSGNSLAKLAQVLHLNQKEAATLLRAAGQPTETHLSARQAIVTTPAPFQAVPQLPYFTGRKHLIKQIEAAIFSSRQQKIIFLHGMAGVGKTALAAELAYRLRASFHDGVLWAETNGTNKLTTLGTMAHGYGLDVAAYTELASRAKMVRQLLTDKQFLLVLDDVQSSTEISELLPTAPFSTVLITTRRQDLAIATGGLRFEVLPFAAEQNEAAALFTQILRRRLTNDEISQVQQIAQALGHLPLALAIAASRLAYEPGWQLADFLARLQHKTKRPQLLTYENLSVQLSFALSYEGLADTLQQFLAKLAIFDGRSFTDTAVSSIFQQPLTDVQDNLRTLHNLSLVQSHCLASGTRYSLHPLLSDCVTALSTPEVQWWQIRQRYVHYYLSLVEDTNQLNVEAIIREAHHIWAALQHAARLKMWSAMLAGLEVAYPYLQRALPPDEIAQFLKKAASVANTLGKTNLSIRCQIWQVALARQQIAFNLANQELASLTFVTQNQNLTRHRAAVCMEKGKTAVYMGNWPAADDYYAEGVLLAQQQNNVTTLIDLWRAKADLAKWRGQTQVAEALLQQALPEAKKLSDKAHLAALYEALAWLAIGQKEYDAADSLAAQGLAIARKIHHQEWQSVLLNTLSAVRHYQGDKSGSNQHQQASFDLAQTLHLTARSASIAANRGGIAWLNGRFKLAEKYWQQSDWLAQQSQNITILINVRLYRARKYLEASHFEKSLATYQAVLTSLPVSANGQGCGFAKGSYGMVQSLLGLGDKKTARPYLSASLAAFALVDIPMVAEMRNLASSLQVDLEDIPQL